MWRWFRLFWLLVALGGVGILVVHYQTSVVTSGYRISGLMEKKETLKERNRRLRIELGRASVPDQVRESFKALTEGETRGDKPGTDGGENTAGWAGRRETR